MIELLPGMPTGVVGIRVSGRLSGEDLRAFTPSVQELYRSNDVRIVEVIAPDYEGFGPGGLTEDVKIGLGFLLHDHSALKRIAVVSDKAWVAHTLHALAWLIPGELKIFGLGELDLAAQWASG